MGKRETLELLRAQMAAIESDGTGDSELFESAKRGKRARGCGHLQDIGADARADAEFDGKSRHVANRCDTEMVARPVSHDGNGVGETPDADGEAAEAFAKIVRLVSASDRSERSIRERLARSGFGGPAVEEAVERARRCRFIDDARFADVLVRSRLAQGRGIAGIERELSEHGIDAYALAGWPEEYTADYPDERQRALDYLNAHPTRSKNPRDGAYRKLVSKGFSTSEASSAARVWAESLLDA